MIRGSIDTTRKLKQVAFFLFNECLSLPYTKVKDQVNLQLRNQTTGGFFIYSLATPKRAAKSAARFSIPSYVARTFSILRISVLKTVGACFVFEGKNRLETSLETSGERSLDTHDLIGTVSETEGTDTGPHGSNGTSNTTTTVELDGTVKDLADDVGDDDLGHTNVSLGGLGADLVHGGGGLEHEETGLFEFHPGVGNVALDLVVLALELAKGPLAGVGGLEEHEVESLLGNTDGAHAVVDTAGTKTALENFETATFAVDKGLLAGDLDVLEENLAVSTNVIVVAKDSKTANNLDTGSVGGDKEHGVLSVAALVLAVSLATDEDKDLAERVGSVRGPPLAAVDDVVLAVSGLGDGGSKVGGVRRGNTGLGHGAI